MREVSIGFSAAQLLCSDFLSVVGVGKSTLLHRFIHDTFEDVYDPTLEGVCARLPLSQQAHILELFQIHTVKP